MRYEFISFDVDVNVCVLFLLDFGPYRFFMRKIRLILMYGYVRTRESSK